MQYNLLSFGCISALLGLTLTPMFTESASAQCVMSHVGVQLNISQSQAKQGSNVQMKNTGPCTGNTTSSTATQVNIGGRGKVEQQQNVRHEMRGGKGNGTGVNGPIIKSNVIVPVDIITPKNFNP